MVSGEGFPMNQSIGLPWITNSIMVGLQIKRLDLPHLNGFLKKMKQVLIGEDRGHST